MSTVRRVLQRVLPPVVFDAVLRLRRFRYGFHGDYVSYEDALQHCHTADGFMSPRIIEKAIERSRGGLDMPGCSMTSREKQLLAVVVTPLLACEARRAIRVLDFGGGLGADYYRVRTMLPATRRLAWTIFETPAMAAAGHANVKADELAFISEWSELAQSYDLVIASSSVQYTRDPVETFERLARLSAPYMVLTRLPLIRGSRDRLTVQRVPPTYYDAAYPAWFLAEGKWLPLIEQRFVVRRRWIVEEDELFLDSKRVINQGVLLERHRPSA